MQYLLIPGKNGRCSKIFENSQIGMSRHLDSSTTTQVAEIMVQKTQSFLLSQFCMVSLWQDCCVKGNLRTYCWSTDGRKFIIGNVFFVHLFLSVYVDEIKLAGKKQNIYPMWKVLDKQVDLGEPTSFLDHVCTQRQCEVSKDIVDNCRTMFESRISEEATEKLPSSGKTEHLHVVLRYGRSCQEMCRTLLRVG